MEVKLRPLYYRPRCCRWNSQLEQGQILQGRS